MRQSHALFWSSPRLPSADFTPEDPLAIDYLGQQVGNWLWPGFTTRTTRAAYYVMVTYGLRVADDLAREHGFPRTDGFIRSTFERWEKLWALSVAHRHGGTIPPSDGIRGSQGAQRYRRQVPAGPWTYDYRLLARQLELGALGAYLTSLRTHGLVAKDRLRLTPRGREVSDHMWGAPSDRMWSERDEFVRVALAPSSNGIPSKVGRVTLLSLGEHARPGALRHRPALQGLLWNRLFSDHAGLAALNELPEIAALLIAADADGVTSPPDFIRGALDGAWRTASPRLYEVLSIASAFGDLSASLRSTFDRTYRAVHQSGLHGRLAAVAKSAIGQEEVTTLGQGRQRFLDDAEAVRRVRSLPSHGAAFVRSVEALDCSTPTKAVAGVLALPGGGARDGGRNAGWLVRDGPGIVIQRSGYRSWSLDASRWVVGYKLAAMRQLLSDLGKLL